LREVGEDVRSGVSEIRRLVYDLRPPALDELGLVGALKEGALACETDGRRVVVEAPACLPPLPAAVEVAAYRIIQEALTNAVRHAQCRTCTVHLSVNDGLDVAIEDDGVGLPSERHIGSDAGSGDGSQVRLLGDIPFSLLPCRGLLDPAKGRRAARP
jgi:signal transduction histidine kinase